MLHPLRRVPGVSVDLPSPHSGGAAGGRGSMLPDLQFRGLSFTGVRSPSVALYPGARRPWGTITVPVAPRDGCERAALEGADRQATLVISAQHTLSTSWTRSQQRHDGARAVPECIYRRIVRHLPHH